MNAVRSFASLDDQYQQEQHTAGPAGASRCLDRRHPDNITP
jgi:hypothetical protein